jgi:hypothetical protein
MDISVNKENLEGYFQYLENKSKLNNMKSIEIVRFESSLSWPMNDHFQILREDNEKYNLHFKHFIQAFS